MKLKAIRYWCIQALNEKRITLGETVEGDQVVLSISGLDGSQIQTAGLGRDEFETLCDLRYEIRFKEVAGALPE